jgi:lipopolysaccharide export system protein LptC
VSPTVQRGAPSLGAPSPRTWRRAWDKASIYLPVLIMGLLALGSYWMLQSAPDLPPPKPEEAPVHEPDYLMRDFSARHFYSDGRLKSEVFGTVARHYPDDDSVEVDQVRIRAFSATGQLTTAQARRLLTDGRQTQFQLEGQVVVVREAHTTAEGRQQPALTFQGEQLRLLDQNRKVESDRPLTMTRHNDRITANSLRYDDERQLALFQGRVRAVLLPTKQ